MNRKSQFLLAIESAIAGGSIALFRGREMVSSRCGDGSVSRAEDLLPNIVAMLDEAGIDKRELSRVAVSLGPGSYTGLRIGISTVMGLKRGLGIEYVGVPLFAALAESAPGALIAVPMGKADVCFSTSDDSPAVISMDAFPDVARSSAGKRVLVHPSLFDRLAGSVDEIDLLSPNLAEFIGRAAMELNPSDRLDPIYVQNPRFG